MKLKIPFLTALMSAHSAFSTEYFVDASRPDNTGAATSWASAKKTIQAAVDLAQNGDTIWVTNGTYGLSSEIQISKNIILQSVNGSSVTIVDGNYGVRCLRLSSVCLVRGFTIQHGYNAELYNGGQGGGIRCDDSGATVSDCIVANNTADFFHYVTQSQSLHGGKPRGGGMLGGRAVNCRFQGNRAVEYDNSRASAYGGSLGGGMYSGTAENCVFWGNTAGGGGGMCQGVASNCIFDSNLALGVRSRGDYAWYGGGIDSGSAYNCIFTNNQAEYGGAMDSGPAVNCVFRNNRAVYQGGGGGYVRAYNCIFISNAASVGGGLYGNYNIYNCTFVNNSAAQSGGGFFSEAGYPANVANCIFSKNTPADFVGDNSLIHYTCSTQLVLGINGNTTSAPLFVDTANGSFQLQSNSPCINAGNNAYAPAGTDLAGNPRIIGGTVDMGAYEFYAAQDDYDSDGLPNGWTVEHFGGITRADANAVCSNGVNTIRQAYIAGLDPNDPTSKFSFSVDRSTPFGNILRWQSVSGREYSVYYSTNLVNGFIPLINHLVTGEGTYIDEIYEYNGPRYYKIDVQIDDNPNDNVTPPSPFI